ncbi:putative O-glycosylation ligase, exosortase A system-associated [Erythrobacter oryzae]|uniref:putative O-glycosylation ligase, exosortase A system-associated n=1 Tax=Erythrobacter oryzae TaxID=3019556 RepID=UPI002552F4A8|nr:putative O-glycosylation ligase, exosortase A system-associated [Erythrobacter sp. COR-2]
MKDLFFLVFIAYVMLLGLRRPFLWVLLYIYIDILSPQRIGYSIITTLPLSLIAFAAAFGGWLAIDRKEGARFTLRQGLMLALLGYCWWTTGNADFPEEALTKWDWVWKALLFAIFLPLTLTTRARIEGLALSLVLSVAMIVIATGLKVVTGGGGYGELNFFVDDNSGIYESSTLATVAIGLIPLLWWLVKHGTVFPKHWTVTLFAAALTFAALLVPIGTEARTGLLCIAALAVLMLRYTKRRLLFIAGAGVLGLTALPFLPQSYYDRMATIAEPGGDESASTRVAVWNWTLDYVQTKPLGGGFDAYRSNRFTYTMPVKKTEGNTTTIEYTEVEDKARAYHSSVFEMLGEQGWPGLGLWLLLHLVGLWQMERIQRRWKAAGEETTRWIAPLAAALQMGAVIYLVGALFQGIAYQPVMLMLVGLQIGLNTYCLRIDSARASLARSASRRAAANGQMHGAVAA